MSIYFSNDFATLATLFGKKYISELKPFSSHIVLVPHSAMKEELFSLMAGIHSQGIAMGPKIMTIDQMRSSFFNVPTKIELALFLFSEGAGCWHRSVSLAKEFLVYEFYGKRSLSSLEEKLWEKSCQRWDIEWLEKLKQGMAEKKFVWSAFGFSFLPRPLLHLLLEGAATCYFFSPCALFWADYSSDKERIFLEAHLSSSQRIAWEKAWEGEHPLLANLGKVGKRMQLQCEEFSSLYEAKEYYISPEQSTLLGVVQKGLLMGEKEEGISYGQDGSLVEVVATSLLREVEALKDFLLTKIEKEQIALEEIIILAPDIGRYAPFLSMVFLEGEYPLALSICGMDPQKEDPLLQTMVRLFAIAKEECSVSSFLLFFSSPIIQEKFGLDLIQIKNWIEKGAIVGGKEGWEAGLKRLVSALGEIEAPIFLERAEIEAFDCFYRLATSLCEDLMPLFDGTKFPLTTWLLYCKDLLEMYVGIDKEEEIYQDLSRLSALVEEKEDSLFSFIEMESMMEDLLKKRGSRAFGINNKKAIRCRSLEEGVIYSVKGICLLGMEEETFPRVEKKGSKDVVSLDFYPRQEDKDRDLFLQALSSARLFLWTSYVANKGEKKGSSVLQALFSLFPDLHFQAVHPLSPYDEKYFSPNSSLYSFSLFQYKKALQGREKEVSSWTSSLLKGPMLPKEKEFDITVEELCQFARHPLRIYLKKRLGYSPLFPYHLPFHTEKASFLPSFRVRQELIDRGMTTPLEEVFSEAKKRGELPENGLTSFFKRQITKEVEELKEKYLEMGIDPKEVTQQEIEPFTLILEGEIIVRIKGSLSHISPKGIVLHSERSLENEVCLRPYAFFASRYHLGPIHYLGKQIEICEKKETEEEFKQYLRYVLCGLEGGSPLIRPLILPLLQGSYRQFDQELQNQKESDPSIGWLFFQDPHLDSSKMYEAWHLYAKELFNGLL